MLICLELVTTLYALITPDIIQQVFNMLPNDSKLKTSLGI